MAAKKKPSPANKKRGPPTFRPTDAERKEVAKMVAVGIPQESICRVVRNGIDDKTLRKHFRKELDTALVKANTNVSGTLYNKAIAGDTGAIVWWEKTRQGRGEKVTLAGDPSNPLQIVERHIVHPKN